MYSHKKAYLATLQFAFVFTFKLNNGIQVSLFVFFQSVILLTSYRKIENKLFLHRTLALFLR